MATVAFPSAIVGVLRSLKIVSHHRFDCKPNSSEEIMDMLSRLCRGYFVTEDS
jgi:hypothetical protein